MTSKQFVKYSPSIEQKIPDEDHHIQEVVDSFQRLNKANFERFRHGLRDAHAKSHGVLRGELKVNSELPPEYRQGVFAAARTYPVIARFSTAPGALMADDLSTFRGLALKLLDVDGDRLPGATESARTQDFLFINHPVLPAGDVKEYASQQLRLEKAAGVPEGLQNLASKALIGVRKSLCPFGYDTVNLLGFGKEITDILGETYFTAGPLRYGDYMSKLSVAPRSENVRSRAGSKIDTKNPSALKDSVAGFFENESAEYEIRVQLSTSLETMPIEDASKPWPEDESPYVTVGTISFPRQNSYSPARRVYGDDVLTFSPFTGLAAHKPLGSVQRAREKAYDSSSGFRHSMNDVERKEPLSISELPD